LNFPEKCKGMNDIVTHSTEDFTWEPERKEFVAERSDFNGKEVWTVFKRIGGYTEAYLYLSNPKTGNKVLFTHLHTLEGKGPDYEIEGHVFGAIPEECEKNPRLHCVHVVILND
jgi:hypothetical protein